MRSTSRLCGRVVFSLLANALFIALLPLQPFNHLTSIVSAATQSNDAVFPTGVTMSDAIISEFMAANNSTLYDQDGDSSDWIEVRNLSASPLDLDGWFLTDDQSNLTKWQFPTTIVPANGYVVVFASSKNQDTPGFELHTNFKLQSGGEYLALVHPDGTTIANEFAPAYPEQYTNVSFGIDNTNSQVYFSPATPGGVNGTGSQIYKLALPAADVGRGFYDSAQTVTLSASPGATIRYTTNGNTPSSSHGTIYNSPLTINSTTTLRFIAYTNSHTSPVATHTYIFVNDVMNQSTMNQSVVNQYQSQMDDALLALPSISLASPHFPLAGDYWNQDVPIVQTSVELIYPDAQENITKGFQVNSGIRKYGNVSINYDKHSMRLFFDSEYGAPDLKWPLFADWGQGTYTPAEKFDTIDLRSGGHGDQFYNSINTMGARERATYIGRRWVADTRLDMGSLVPHGFYVHMYINGTYWGQFHVNEKMDGDFAAAYGTGDDADYEAVKSTNRQNGNTYSLVDGTGATWQGIIDNANNYGYVKDRLNLSDYLDQWLVRGFLRYENEYRAAGPSDAATEGGYLIDSVDPDGVFNPVIYYNLWGTLPNEDLTGWGGLHGIFDSLWDSGNADFRVLVADRIANAFFSHGEFSGALTTAGAQGRFDEWRGVIGQSILAETARWINDPNLPNTWLNYMNSRSTFVGQRSPTVLQQLRNRGYFPVEPLTFTPDGGWVSNSGNIQVTINDPNSNSLVFYTTDGSDPRQPGGAVAPTASQYTGPINLTQATVLSARPLKNGTWGPMTVNTFHVNPQASIDNLRITEIHYNPDGSDETEFIEFKNISNAAIDLTDVMLKQGVSFTFGLMSVPAGGHFVVVENIAAFSDRYQNPASAYYQPNLLVAGQWNGALNNGGEVIAVHDEAGVAIFTVDYNDGGAWPGRADGNGSSLEIENINDMPNTQPELDTFLANSGSWQPSSEFHGSPGRDGLGPDNRIVINEVLANSEPPVVDTIEFYNTISTTIDLSNWFVSDTSKENTGGFKKYRFPQGTTLAIDSYLVIDETDFNDINNPNSLVQFALNASQGDDVYLLEADSAGNLLRFVDRVEFPASATNESFGRWPNGIGDIQPLVQTTWGANNESNNNAIRVGPVVISEIHYNPGGIDPDENLEFIEITNAGTVTETLENWRMRGEVDFDFSAGVGLAPQERLVLVSFDPANATQAAIFRSVYNLDEDVPLYGPWTNNDVVGVKLDNGGATLRLQRADALVTPQDGSPAYTPMLIEDTVAYDDDPPWPVEADGTGASLMRINLLADGNDASNWEAGSPPLLTCTDVQPITDLGIGRVGFDTIRLFWTALNDGVQVEVWRSPYPYFMAGDPDSELLSTLPSNRNSEDDNSPALQDITTNHFYRLRTVNQCGDGASSNTVGEFEYALTETGSSDFNWVGLPLIVDGINASSDLVTHITNNTSQNGVGVNPNVEAVEQWNPASQSYDSYLPALPFLGDISIIVGRVYRVTSDLPGDPTQTAIWTLLGEVPDVSVFTQQLYATGSTNYNWVMLPLNAHDLSMSSMLLDDVQASSVPTVTTAGLDRWNAAAQSMDSYIPDFFLPDIPTQTGHAYRVSLDDGVAPGMVAEWE
ncbi:MAG: lamin tail domain-containing protein [Chloroflexota bacterium]